MRREKRKGERREREKEEKGREREGERWERPIGQNFGKKAYIIGKK